MRQAFAARIGSRRLERPARSIACLAFVALLAAAFWVATAYVAQMLLNSGALGL